MDLNKMVPKYKKKLIADTCKFLKIESVLTKYDRLNQDYPFGEGIRDALDYILNLAEKDGFITKNIDNHVGYIEYGTGEELFCILCHVDVVPAEGEWDFPPFSGTLVNDRIYSRGSVDDKGPTMSAYYALKIIKDSGVKLNKRIRIILGCDEESGWRGIKRYLETEKKPNLGFAPDANFPLIYGEKGMIDFSVCGIDESEIVSFQAGTRHNVVPEVCKCKVTSNLKKEFAKYLMKNNIKGKIVDNEYIIYGKSAHAMQPEKGINSATLMALFLKDHINSSFINFIIKYFNFDHTGKEFGIDFYTEEMKELTINSGVFKYENNIFSITVNIRFPIGADTKFILKKINSILDDYEYSNIDCSIIEPHYVDPNSELVTTLLSVYQKHTDDYESKIMTIGGGTYAKAFDNVVAYGPVMPNSEDTVHQANEYILVDDLVKSCLIYADCLFLLCGI